MVTEVEVLDTKMVRFATEGDTGTTVTRYPSIVPVKDGGYGAVCVCVYVCTGCMCVMQGENVGYRELSILTYHESF